MLILGLLSAFFLGPITGVPGLVWARRMRPLSGNAWLGYALCWYGSFAACTVALLFSGRPRAGFFELAGVLVFSLAWLAICRKWLRPPARTRLAALAIAIAGTLMMGVVLVPSVVAVAVPLPLGIVAYALLGPMEGRMAGAMALMFALPVFFLFPAHLALYWPAREAAVLRVSDETRLDAKTRRLFRYGMAYLVGGVFLAWTVGGAAVPFNRVFGVMPGVDLLWALVMPFASLASALVDFFSPARETGEVMVQLIARLASFLIPFCITLALMTGRHPEWLDLLGRAREAANEARR